MGIKVDLQVQTSASDGEYSLDRVLDLAFKESLSALAITDHDTTDAWDDEDKLSACVDLYNRRFNKAEPMKLHLSGSGVDSGTFFVGPLQVIQGEEITCHYRNGEVHLLAYFLERNSGSRAGLYEHNRRMWHAHRAWAERLCTLLTDDGYPVSHEELLETAISTYGLKPYILPKLLQQRHGAKLASELNEQGAPSIQKISSWLNAKYKLPVEQFYRLPDESSAAPFPHIRDAIRLVLDAKAVPVLSHPGRYSHLQEPEPVIEELLGFSKGHIGFEVYNKRHTAAQIELWESATNSFGVLKTGGSDYHGHPHRLERLGVELLQQDFEALFALKKRIVESKL